ncbi:hypothetical protein Hanom_Chr04g00385541 [Helianthus anomalus]
MENIVTIYRNLEATFNANVIHPVCSDVRDTSTQCPTLLKTDANNNLRKANVDIVKEGSLVTPAGADLLSTEGVQPSFEIIVYFYI